MIHLTTNNKQQQVLSQQTQPPVQIPNPYLIYHQNNNKNTNKNNKNQKSGKRQKRDDDWDICWDYLSPKGCNRGTCRWRHDNPQVDQQQIAKRRKRYMEQGRKERDMRRTRTLIGGPNRNRKRKRNNHNHNLWQNMPPVPPHSMLQGPPPPPPYFPPAPPQIPPPQPQSQTQPQTQSPQDYYAQYYAAYGYMQPSNDKKQPNNPPAYGYPPVYGAYPYSTYPYAYPPYGYMQAAANTDKEQSKAEDSLKEVQQKEKPQIDDVKEEDKDKNVDEDDNEIEKHQEIDMDENEVKHETEEINELVFNDDDNNENAQIEEIQAEKENKKEKEENAALEPLDDPQKIAEKVTIVNEQQQNIDAQTQSNQDTNVLQTELQSMPQGAGKKAIVSGVVSKANDEHINHSIETKNNETIDLLSPSPPRQCASNCKCDICCYKQRFQATPMLNVAHNNRRTLPARHPMFDGMEYKHMDDDDVDITLSTHASVSWHKKQPDPALPQPFAHSSTNNKNTNKSNDIDMKDVHVHNHCNKPESFPHQALEYNLPKPSNNTPHVFTTDPQTNASSVTNTLQQHQQLQQSQHILQNAQQQALCAQQQLQVTMASLAQNNLYYDPSTGQYIDLISGAINTPNPIAAYNAYYAQLVGNIQNNTNNYGHNREMDRNLVSNSAVRRSILQIEETNKKTKKKKKKKKGIDSCVKWLYIISDAKRECYGSLCRGQFDTITTTKWLTSLYEEADWGSNGVKDRSRQQADGPTANHIAWYTLSGCNCSLNDCIQDDDSSNAGFPIWLQQIADSVMKICSCDKDPPNCAELFFFENKTSRWNWHTYCQHDIFGVNTNNHNNKHKGQTVHLWLGCRKQFKFAPRRTKAIPGDEEKSIYLENGDVFVTCGKFTEDYVIKIDCEEDLNAYESNSRAHSTMYIVWRWIVNHNSQCLQKDNF